MTHERKPPAGSLRALGGTGKKVRISDVNDPGAIEQILNGPPLLAAMAVMNEGHHLRRSIRAILDSRALEPTQYELIGGELLAYAQRNGNDALRAKDNALIRAVIEQCGGETAAKLRTALAPKSDHDGTLDVTG